MQTETVTPMFQVFWSIPFEVKDPIGMNFVLIYIYIYIYEVMNRSRGGGKK